MGDDAKRMIEMTPKIQEMMKQESQGTGRETGKPSPSEKKLIAPL
jgi:hypothetical protein